MTTTQREKDIERFDHWSSTYEQSWLQRAFFEQAHSLLSSRCATCGKNQELSQVTKVVRSVSQKGN